MMDFFKKLFEKPEWKKRGYRSRSEFIYFHPECRTTEEIKLDILNKTNKKRLSEISHTTQEESTPLDYCWIF